MRCDVSYNMADGFCAAEEMGFNPRSRPRRATIVVSGRYRAQSPLFSLKFPRKGEREEDCRVLQQFAKERARYYLVSRVVETRAHLLQRERERESCSQLVIISIAIIKADNQTAPNKSDMTIIGQSPRIVSMYRSRALSAN